MDLATPNILEASTKTKMIDIAKQVWLLADHTKNGKVSFAQFADLSQIEHLIVDDKVPRDTLKEIEEAGICVSVVSL